MNDEPTETSGDEHSPDEAPNQRVAGQFDAEVVAPDDEFRGDEPAPGNTIGLRGGLAAMLAGAVMLTVGMVSTTAAYSGRPNCPKGSVLVADFDYVPGDDGGAQNPSDDQGVPEGEYVLVYPDDTDAPVTIIEGDRVGGLWISNSPISAIVVSGGIGSTRTKYTPAQDSGVFSHKDLPLVDGQTPDVEHVRFCSPKTAATTTTAPSTSAPTTTDPYTTAPSTTAPSTTAVDETTTTVTDGTTTTTAVDQTTTTVTDGTTTTTVVDDTTTTTEVSPTSIVGSTTTTTISEETTTTIGGTTTTTAVDQTTTTVPEVRGRVTVQTEVTEHDDDEQGQVLALTGSSSLPLVALGTVLLLGGGTVVLASRSRMRADS